MVWASNAFSVFLVVTGMLLSLVDSQKDISEGF